MTPQWDIDIIDLELLYFASGYYFFRFLLGKGTTIIWSLCCCLNYLIICICSYYLIDIHSLELLGKFKNSRIDSINNYIVTLPIFKYLLTTKYN